jgi:hypothetical protein
MPLKLFVRPSRALVTPVTSVPAPTPAAGLQRIGAGASAALDRPRWRGQLVRAFVLAGGQPRRDETTLAALVRLVARADAPAGDADRAILTALVTAWRRLRRDEDLPALTAIDQLRAFMASDEEAAGALPR